MSAVEPSTGRGPVPPRRVPARGIRHGAYPPSPGGGGNVVRRCRSGGRRNPPRESPPRRPPTSSPEVVRFVVESDRHRSASGAGSVPAVSPSSNGHVSEFRIPVFATPVRPSHLGLPRRICAEFPGPPPRVCTTPAVNTTARSRRSRTSSLSNVSPCVWPHPRPLSPRDGPPLHAPRRPFGRTASGRCAGGSPSSVSRPHVEFARHFRERPRPSGRTRACTRRRCASNPRRPRRGRTLTASTSCVSAQ